jgi:hypothetical protein
LNHRLRREEGAGRSTLTLRKVRAVLELRHVEVELSFEQRPARPRITTRSRTTGLRHGLAPRGCDTRIVGWADYVSLLNPRFEPSMATRGGRRPGLSQRWRHEEAAPSRHNHGVEPAITTRGRRRTQRANSAQGAGRLRVTTPSQNRKKGRGWHTNRYVERALLVSHLAISCRDPNRFEPSIVTRGGGRTQPESNQRLQTGPQAAFRTVMVPDTGLDTTA